MSSVKVNGEQTANQPYTENMAPQPEDAYGRTKHETEILIIDTPNLKSTIIRSPLVYGPGVKGNFLKLVQLSNCAFPFPLGLIKNQRSLIYLETYLVSDNQDISTPELLRQTAKSLNKPLRLIPFPVLLLRLAAIVFGKSGVIKRLTGSLQVDCSKIQKELAWTPPISLQQGLDKTAFWYQNQPKL